MDRCRALHDKYLTLRSLRLAYAESGEVAPREQLRALSRRFPGALRELDRLPLEHIEQRLAELEAALGGAAPVPDWVPLQLAYHGWLRLALMVRAGERSESPEQTRARLQASHTPGPGEPDPAQLGTAELGAIRRPPGGRLNLWVFARLSQEFSQPLPAVEAALFPNDACHGARRSE